MQGERVIDQFIDRRDTIEQAPVRMNSEGNKGHAAIVTWPQTADGWPQLIDLKLFICF